MTPVPLRGPDPTAPTVVATKDQIWTRAVEQHGRRVVVHLLAMGVEIEAAKEIAQRAWARIFEQHRAGRLERLELPGVVIQQARFFALDARRGRREGPATLVANTPDPERQLLAREQIERAFATIERCSPRAQQVFRMAYEDPSRRHADIAADVGLSVQRVRQILCEVRRAVRDALEDDQ
ncbi:MAG: sigma-70 family RNA polymerase sigma factor [Deltaproteobacteria bacterium]|jgi:RNA polymerase sigma factor (sigma-70 family)